MIDHAGAGVEHDEADPEAFRNGGGGFELGLNDAIDEVEALSTREFADGIVVDWAVASECRKVKMADLAARNEGKGESEFG